MAIKEKYTIICDEVRQENNGKFIIIGVYQGTIAIPQLPFVMPSLTFFQSLENDRVGSWNMRMKIQHLESGKELASGMGAINFARPGTGISAIRLPNVPLIAAGTYNFVQEFDQQSDPIIVPFDVLLVIPEQQHHVGFPPGMMGRRV